MFSRIGQFVERHRWGVLLAWLALAGVLHVLAPGWSEVAKDGDLEQLPAYTTTTRGARLNAQAFPNELSNSQLVLVFARQGQRLTPPDRQFGIALGRKIAEIDRLPLVGDIWTPQTPIIGEMLVSPGGRAEEIVIRLKNDFMAMDNMRILDAVEQIVERERAAAPAGLEIGVTGSTAMGADMLNGAAESLRSTELTTIILVTLTLLIIYRSAWLVVIPLASIGLAILTSVDLLAILARWSLDHPDAWPTFRIFTTTRLFIVVLLFGAGTDFCLFLIARFRELRTEGRPQGPAVAESVGRVGAAISASAFTTITGLAMMGFADFGKFTYSGPAIAVSLAVMLAICLTVAPALLATRLGLKVAVHRAPSLDDSKTIASAAQARRRTHSAAEREELETVARHRVWSRIADFVLARPGTVLAVSALAAAPFMWQGLHAEVTYDLFSELPEAAISRHGTELLQRYFPPGETGPLILLAKLPAGELTGDDGRLKIAELSKLVYDTQGASKVRSLYRPTGEAPGAVSIFSTRGLTALAAAGSPLAKEAFVATLPDGVGDVTRLFVTLSDGPFSPAATATVERMETALARLAADADSQWHAATFEFQGPTSGIRDLERVTTSDLRRIQILVSVAVFVVILILLRRPLVCLYLIATVIAGYLVTLGVVSLAMRAAYGAEYPGLDWKAPVFLFVILVAVGQDYNILLVDRVFEEQRRLGLLPGLRRAMIQTGGIITSCGVIMAATFASLLTGSLRSMVEMGSALSFGILLDTLLVRTILVPAFLAILARRQPAFGGRTEPAPASPAPQPSRA